MTTRERLFDKWVVQSEVEYQVLVTTERKFSDTYMP